MNADPVDEQGEESFPASDPPEGWAGPDGPRVAGVGEEPEVPDPIPEADSATTAEAWEGSGAMEGPAPTG